MARKKSRPAAASRSVATPPASTAVVGGSAVTGIATTSPRPASRSGGADTRTEKAFLETPVGRFLHRVFRVFSSLQLAITLLTLFTLSLITATLIDSAHGLEIAQQVVYRTWWFTLLLFLLGTNIFCAAMKRMDLKKLAEGRWPWKKYQTGFLVTHVGLITLVFGGLLTNLSGEDGQMVMLDTKDEAIQIKSGNNEQTTDRLYLIGEYTINVFEVVGSDNPHDKRVSQVELAIRRGQPVPDHLKDVLAGSWSLPFRPGHLPWYDEGNFRSNMPWYLRTLRSVAEPVRGYSRSVGDATLTVNNFLPHTDVWPYSTAPDGEGFPALMLEISSPMTGGVPRPEWVASVPSEDSGLPLCLDFFHVQETGLLKEFFNPPPAKEMGKDGLLVLAVGEGPRQVFRFPVNRDKLDAKVKVGDTGLTLQINALGNLQDMGGGHAEADLPNCPLLRFKLSRGEESTEYASMARYPGQLFDMSNRRMARDVAAWYHTGDPFWGDTDRMGALQFLQGPDGKLYSRAYGKGGEARGSAQELDVSDPEAVHRPPLRMPLTFKVGAYLPHAVKKEQIVPRNLVRIGAKPPNGVLPALRGTLSFQGKEYPFEAHLRRTAEVRTDGKHRFLIQCRQAVKKTNFTVTLDRSWQVTDPGSERAAEYHSRITVKPGINGEKDGSKHHLFMNHTLDYAGYRFFQSGFEPTPFEVDGRLANVSTLSVAQDPGLWFKYAGTLIVVLGIAIMFYMKAYFFKSRGKTPVEEQAVAIQ